MLQQITEELAIGNAAEVEKLEKIAQQGYRTFIDLCPAQEGDRLNASLVEAHGLEYCSVPVYRNDIDRKSLETFMQTIESVPKPIYTRCASGTRASLMTLLSLATKEKWTESQFFERLASIGFAYPPNSPHERFARGYLHALRQTVAE
ncbi:beta-lactamase hydrolase domain-containing protein [Myxosarcina sp. GI1]|uniref:beta-lactamase hydrolase domain-containing protein n=1 Tax=Myxosarcina sp. GI1 TaxID=1541065 RepID=UPI000566A518|nr:sulfur transferase domain-containing protein [Myxosarcina sp. GI1]